MYAYLDREIDRCVRNNERICEGESSPDRRRRLLRERERERGLSRLRGGEIKTLETRKVNFTVGPFSLGKVHIDLSSLSLNNYNLNIFSYLQFGP